MFGVVKAQPFYNGTTEDYVKDRNMLSVGMLCLTMHSLDVKHFVTGHCVLDRLFQLKWRRTTSALVVFVPSALSGCDLVYVCRVYK